MKHPWYVFTALWLGCAPADRSGTVMAKLVVWDEASRTYAPTLTPVENLESLQHLVGRDLEFRSGTIVRDDNPPSFDRGYPFDLAYSVENGVIVPVDFGSLYALGLYRNLDRIANMLRTEGWNPPEKLSVFVLPRIDNLLLGDKRLMLVDNAAYLALAHAYVIFPPLVTPGVPLSLNFGVTAHEFGHAVVNTDYVRRAVPKNSFEFSCANEGIADLFAVAITGEPNFIAPSVDTPRDLSVPVDYTTEAALALTDKSVRNGELADAHWHGSVMARAVYEFWPRAQPKTLTLEERGTMLRSLLAALGEMRADDNTLAGFVRALLRQLDSNARPAACAVVRQRLAPIAASITECAT
jgi:hypothetical protein